MALTLRIMPCGACRKSGKVVDYNKFGEKILRQCELCKGKGKRRVSKSRASKS